MDKWTQDRGNSSKLAIYHTFKSELEPEDIQFCLDATRGDDSVFREVFYSRLTNYYLEKWTQERGNSSKLAIYHTFKSELEPEDIY